MEKQQFPQIHELITGKFYRHSQELYYWRVKNRADLLKKYPDSLNYYDDLAMAYDKIGNPKKAIEVMKKKELKKAGLYETYANLGLFYMHNNDMKNGVLYVQKALKVNPNAHFGREKYQLHLGKYIISRMKNDSLILPLTSGFKTGFYEYLAKHEFKTKDYKSDEHFKEVANAIKGVAGMMTFANYRSPVLLEVLADLLLHTNSYRGAGNLASRAYLKASWETKGEVAKSYYEKTKWAREPIRQGEMIPGAERRNGDGKITSEPNNAPSVRIANLETALKYEIQLAEIWFDSIRVNEINWIKEGLNPDSAFAINYYENKELKNKSYDVYEIGLIEKKVQNEVWLKQQLTKPVDVNNIHGYNSLGDSIATVLDKIYAEEFAQAEVKEIKVFENPEPKKENKPSNIIYILYLLVGMLGLLIIWRVYKLSRKNN